jgi:hypothetical protein
MPKCDVSVSWRTKRPNSFIRHLSASRSTVSNLIKGIPSARHDFLSRLFGAHSMPTSNVLHFLVFSMISLIISFPSLTASGNRGAKYSWILSNRSRYASNAPNETQSDHA